VDFNTVQDSSGSGVSIRNIGTDVEVSQNVLFNLGDPIFIDFAKSALLVGNCMDAPIRTNITITSENNQETYPACL